MGLSSPLYCRALTAPLEPPVLWTLTAPLEPSVLWTLTGPPEPQCCGHSQGPPNPSAVDTHKARRALSWPKVLAPISQMRLCWRPLGQQERLDEGGSDSGSPPRPPHTGRKKGEPPACPGEGRQGQPWKPSD